MCNPYTSRLDVSSQTVIKGKFDLSVSSSRCGACVYAGPGGDQDALRAAVVQQNVQQPGSNQVGNWQQEEHVITGGPFYAAN